MAAALTKGTRSGSTFVGSKRSQATSSMRQCFMVCSTRLDAAAEGCHGLAGFERVGAYGMLHRDEHRNAPHHNMRVPDLAVTCADVDARQIALPEALLIVEILSPTDASDTWENVLTYVSIPSGSGTAGAPVCL